MTASKLHRENQALCSPILAVQLHTQNLTLLEPEIFLKDLGSPKLSSRDLSYPGIELTPPVAPDLQVDSLRLSHWGSPKVQSPTLHLVNESHSPVGLGLCRAALCCPQMFWISSLCSQLRQPLVPWSAVSIQHGHLCSWTLYASLGRKGDCVGWKRGWDPSVPVSIP